MTARLSLGGLGRLRARPRHGVGTRLREESGRDRRDRREIGLLRVAVARRLRLDQRRPDDDARQVLVADVLHDRGQLREAIGRQIRADRLADSGEQIGELEEQASAPRRPVAQRDQDLLLARLAGEVALAEPLARPRVGKRIRTIEVMRAGGDRVALLADVIAVIARVGETVGDVDVDPADGVDHLDEAAEVDPCVVVDRDAEQRADRVLEGSHPALREVLRSSVRVGHQRVELGTEGVAIAERRVDQVTRDRDAARRYGRPGRAKRPSSCRSGWRCACRAGRRRPAGR